MTRVLQAHWRSTFISKLASLLMQVILGVMKRLHRTIPPFVLIERLILSYYYYWTSKLVHTLPSFTAVPAPFIPPWYPPLPLPLISPFVYCHRQEVWIRKVFHLCLCCLLSLFSVYCLCQQPSQLYLATSELSSFFELTQFLSSWWVLQRKKVWSGSLEYQASTAIKSLCPLSRLLRYLINLHSCEEF